MAVSGVLGWQNIRGLAVRIDLPEEIYSGLDTLMTVRLRNRKRHLPSFLLRARICGAVVDFPILPRNGEESLPVVVNFPQRGRRGIDTAEVCSPFPVNFFVRCTRVPVGREVVVFPAPLGCALSPDEGRSVQSGVLQSSARGYDGEMAKISDYAGGEPLKLIHWRLSARHESFKVKELSATAQEPVMIDVASLPRKSLEENLSCATYLINRLTRQHRPVGLRARDRVFPPGADKAHRLRMLRELALYD